MKVLHIYAGNLFGGIETLLITLAQYRHLCPEMEPHFALCFEGRLAQELERTGVKVHRLGHVQISNLWTVWRSRRKLQQILSREKYDVAICHGCWIQGIFGSAVKAASLPLVFWCHDTPQGTHWLERLAKLTKPDLAIANSKYTLGFLPNLYTNLKTSVLYCPVAANDLGDLAGTRQKIRDELNVSPEKVVIIQVSRLERLKGHSQLVAALAKLQDIPHWECWIVGGAQRPKEIEYLNELQVQVKADGISDRLKFLGQRSDVPTLLAAADIYCQPNVSAETFGIAFIEALYAGLPVVTTAIGGGAEIVNSSCGILVEPNNHPELANALRSLINSKSQRQELGSHGRDRAVELCDPAQQINQLYICLNFKKSEILVG
jgi:glycosyltransferase involved in cell wall biosynthesis